MTDTTQITRCPECATAFKVTPEQLDARKGRVRCGHCGEIFDALSFIEGEAEAAPGPDPVPEPPSPTPAPDVEMARATEEPPKPLAAKPATQQALPDGPAFEPLTQDLRPGGAPRRLWWGLCAALLLAALVVQALFYFRGAIALVWPEAKLYIEPLCARLGCDIPMPRRADLMSIETSDLQAEPSSPGVMVLSATLRNRAAFVQAYPALELTLTNERDQPLARRVLKPPEYLKSSPTDGIPSCSGGVPSCEVQVRLYLEAASLKASGYRLYLFYP